MTAEITSTSRPPVSDALVSVVLPVYNESAVLRELCRRLRTALVECRTTFEIIFVNDGSRDGSTALLDRLAQQYADVRVIHLSRNFGQQAAIHAGLTHARGDAVVIMNADLRDPPETIGPLLDAWQAGNDVVYAIRDEQQSLLQRAFCPADSRNFGVIDARVLQIILALGKQDCTFPELRTWVGFRQFGIMVDESLDDCGRPRSSLRQHFRNARKALRSAQSAPLAVFAWISIGALVVLLATGGYALYCRQIGNVPVPGWVLQVANTSFFAALNALGVSVLGNYLVRIYDHLRARPLYLIDRTINCVEEPHQVDSAGEELTADDRATPAKALDLEQLDPLEIDRGYDNAYQHLLDDAHGLMELGDLVRSEADDLADRESHASTTSDEIPSVPADAQSNGGACCDEEPRLLKLSSESRR